MQRWACRSSARPLPKSSCHCKRAGVKAGLVQGWRPKNCIRPTIERPSRLLWRAPRGDYLEELANFVTMLRLSKTCETSLRLLALLAAPTVPLTAAGVTVDNVRIGPVDTRWVTSPGAKGGLTFELRMGESGQHCLVIIDSSRVGSGVAATDFSMRWQALLGRDSTVPSIEQKALASGWTSSFGERAGNETAEFSSPLRMPTPAADSSSSTANQISEKDLIGRWRGLQTAQGIALGGGTGFLIRTVQFQADGTFISENSFGTVRGHYHIDGTTVTLPNLYTLTLKNGALYDGYGALMRQTSP